MGSAATRQARACLRVGLGGHRGFINKETFLIVYASQLFARRNSPRVHFHLRGEARVPARGHRQNANRRMEFQRCMLINNKTGAAGSTREWRIANGE